VLWVPEVQGLHESHPYPVWRWTSPILESDAVTVWNSHPLLLHRLQEHTTKMPKRKAKELDNGVPAEEPRRSSRRVSLPATTEEAPKTTNPAPKRPKKVQKPSTDESTVDKVKGGDNEELVRILPI
jgi:hypothetical protein